MSTMTVTVPSALLLTANQRLHHMAKARQTKQLRTLGYTHARGQGIPHHNRAHVTVTVTWPDRRRRDVMNIAPTIKALIDGMTDAGCWPDDNDRHLIGPDLRVATETTGTKGLLRLDIEVREPPENGV